MQLPTKKNRKHANSIRWTTSRGSTDTGIPCFDEWLGCLFRSISITDTEQMVRRAQKQTSVRDGGRAENTFADVVARQFNIVV